MVRTPVLYKGDGNPPYDHELEKALLACLLVDFGTLYPQIERVIAPDDFHSELHADAYKLLRRLYERYGRLDIVLLLSEGKDSGVKVDTLVEYMSGPFFTYHAPFYAQKLFDLAQRRRLIAIAGQQAQAGYELPAPEALEAAEAMLAGVIAREGRLEDGRIGSVLADIRMDTETAQAHAEGHMLGWSTGLACYDNWTSGLRRKQLHMIGGYAGTGKSHLCAHLGLTAAKQGAKVAIFSCEMAATSMAQRMVSALAGIERRHLYAGMLTDDELQARTHAEGQMSALALRIYEKNRSWPLIASAVREWRPDLVLVDYVQKIASGGMDEYEAVTHHSGALQDLAVQQNCCVVAFSQMSNEAASGRLGGDVIGFKSSGALAADPDVAVVLLRNKDKEPNILTVWCRKNRHGPEGMDGVWLDLATSRFREMHEIERQWWKQDRRIGGKE